MTIEEQIEAYAMRLDGYALQEIADKFGVSRQRIQQIIGPGSGHSVRRPNPCMKYPNIGKWLIENKMTQCGLANKSGIASAYLSNILLGKINPGKKIIDKILLATGMTYEEAFKEE